MADTYNHTISKEKDVFVEVKSFLFDLNPGLFDKKSCNKCKKSHRIPE